MRMVIPARGRDNVLILRQARDHVLILRRARHAYRAIIEGGGRHITLRRGRDHELGIIGPKREWFGGSLSLLWGEGLSAYNIIPLAISPRKAIGGRH